MLPAVALWVLLAAPACRTQHENREGPAVQRPTIEQVLAQHSPALMQRPGVVGVYQSAREDGSPAITVMVLDSTAVDSIPRELDGYPVEIEISGPIRPLDEGR